MGVSAKGLSIDACARVSWDVGVFALIGAGENPPDSDAFARISDGVDFADLAFPPDAVPTVAGCGAFTAPPMAV